MQKCYQKSVDMGLKVEENMYGWVGFFISGPYTLSCAKNTCKVYVTNVLYNLGKKIQQWKI